MKDGKNVRMFSNQFLSSLRKAASMALALWLVPFMLSAQSVLPGAETRLTLTPQSPQPGQEFTVRIEAYHYDLAHAQIAWTIDGTAAPAYANMQAVTLIAPAPGETRFLRAQVTERDGEVHAASETVIGQSIDLIVEGGTRVPHFYQGRALPSNGSSVRLIAQPSLFTAGGVRIDPDTLIYTWHINNSVVHSGQDANVLLTTMPRRGELRVRVTAETRNGSVRHTSIATIEPAASLNVFYEDSPLYGIAHNALPSQFTLLQNEMSVRAEPFYVAQNIFEHAQYTWSINQSAVANPNADPQTLTLRKTGGAGSAEVTFSIRNLQALQQAAESSFVVHFEN